MIDADRVFELHASAVAGQELVRRGEERECVHGALGAALTTASYYENPDDPLVTAALVLRNLVSAHCFGDGNKRVAWLACVDVLLAFGLTLDVSDDVSELFVLEIAKSRVEPQLVAEWLAERIAAD